MRRAIFLLVLLVAGMVSAEEVCPCVPIAHVWTVETCSSWNCAVSASLLAEGDPYVVAVPAPTRDGRWLVVKRVNAGGYVAAPDAPFVAETFDEVAGASARFQSLAADHAPVMLSVADGKFVVVMSREALPKRRAVKR